ncbi:MAG: ribosome maturation factor RimM, partial [Eubacteriales bacterium]|nr:ribosome maturation factor RimM [Eubacteriales bacterium]
MRDPYLLLGIVVKPQGLHGEVKLHHETGDPARFLDLTTVYLRRGEVYAPATVLGARLSGSDVYLTFEGVDDREAAEKLRGQTLYIDRAHARPLGKGEVFVVDLLGVHATDTDGNEIGTITDVMQNGGADVLVFSTPRGPMMAPFLKRLVRELDVSAARM